MSIFITAVMAMALGFVAAFALLLGGYWKAPELLKQQILALPGALWAACRMALKGIKQTVLAPFRKQHALPVKFRDWVACDLGGHPALQAWLLSLPEPVSQALTQGTVRYCVDLKIELSWLAERHVDVAPAVQQAVKAIVVDYLQGCWQAVCHKDGIALFGIYHQLAANPADTRQIDLRRRLFTRLAASGCPRRCPPTNSSWPRSGSGRCWRPRPSAKPPPRTGTPSPSCLPNCWPAAAKIRRPARRLERRRLTGRCPCGGSVGKARETA